MIWMGAALSARQIYIQEPFLSDAQKGHSLSGVGHNDKTRTELQDKLILCHSPACVCRSINLLWLHCVGF